MPFVTDTIKYGGLNLVGTGTSGLAALTEGQFAHFAIVVDDAGDVTSVYVNGTEYVQDISNGYNVNYDLGTVLGGRIYNPSESGDIVSYELAGALDDFALILGELNATQIAAAMNNGVATIIGGDPIPGDTNGDQIVNDTDAATLATNWGATGVTGGAAVGDFNADTNVDAADASILAANWGDHTSEAGEGVVPEPTMFGLLLTALAALTLLQRRRD